MTPITEYSIPNMYAGFAQTFSSLDSREINDDIRNKFFNFYNTTTYSATCGPVNISKWLMTTTYLLRQFFILKDFNAGPLDQIKAQNVYTKPDLCKPTTTSPAPVLTQIFQTFSSFFNWFLNLFRRS